MFWYAKLIPLFPLLGFLFNGLYGLLTKGKTNNKLVSIIGCGSLGVSLLLTIVTFAALAGMEDRSGHELVLFDWITSGSFQVSASFLIDPLSCVMLLVVTGVGFLIHVYSTGYMGGAEEKERYFRFFAYLNLFVFFMLLLVMGANFLIMFVGWEGVGLCSYLLIGFWYTKKSASDAGKKAFVVNRVGDFGFVLAIMLIFVVFGTIDFKEVFHKAPDLLHKGGGLATAITLLLFVGATGKSAQIPLYVWLPDAMEGPTPVSALIHAATMVTAGVYMVARCSALYMLAPLSLVVVAFVGAGTALLSASIGLLQNDIKRVLAYSTVSQLGYMFMGCGVGAFGAGIFHLMTHAFFKGLLFLGAGSVIHGMSGEQDMRHMGALRKHMPITYITFLAATLAIAGIPPFAGFFSKDEILFKAFTDETGAFGPLRYLVWMIGAVGAFMTAFYMFRLLLMTFHGKSRVTEHAKHHLHESPYNMTVPLMVLAVLSLIGGWVGMPVEGWNKFHEWVGPVFGHAMGHAAAAGEAEVHESGMLEVAMMFVSVAIAVGGILLAFIMYIWLPELPSKLESKARALYKLIYNKYYVDEIYQVIFVNHTKVWGYVLKWFDENVVDGIVNGVSRWTRRTSSGSIWGDQNIVDMLVNLCAQVVQWNSQKWRRIQTGFVQNYGLSMAVGVFLLVGIYYFYVK